MRRPRPSSPPRVLEQAAETRRLDCAGYAGCLDQALTEGWPGFACGDGCYEPIDAEQRARDLPGLIMIARLAETL